MCLTAAASHTLPVEVPAWVSAPPSASIVTSSWVTVFTTLGPVTNMYDVPRTMNTKSVMAGE